MSNPCCSEDVPGTCNQAVGPSFPAPIHATGYQAISRTCACILMHSNQANSIQLIIDRMQGDNVLGIASDRPSICLSVLSWLNCLTYDLNFWYNDTAMSVGCLFVAVGRLGRLAKSD